MSSTSVRPRIGVFGGTFDPPHLGHLVAAMSAVEVLELDRLLFVPARRSPHRMEESLSPPDIRLEMVRAAASGVDEFEVDDLELRRDGPSYTVDTLEALSRSRPDAAFHLLMGADQWSAFGRWHRPREIARLASLAILRREGDGPGEIGPDLDDGPPPEFDEVPMTRIDISASLIRRRVREGRSVRFLVTDAVRRIIDERNLYLSGTPSGSGRSALGDSW